MDQPTQPTTVWTQPKWFPKVNGTAKEASKFSPQAFGVADRFYIVWVNVDSGKLMWCYEQDGGEWSESLRVQEGEEADIVTCSPSVAVLDGVAHLVYSTVLEPKSADGVAHLVHLQLDTELDLWVRRCGVLARTKPDHPPALAPFHEALWCVYRDATTQFMAMSRWTERSGWTKSKLLPKVQATAVEPTMFELNDTLHLLVVAESPGTTPIQHYCYVSDLWHDLGVLGKRDGFPGWTSNVGVTAESVNDRVFVAFCNGSEMTTAQYVGGLWSLIVPAKKMVATRTPSIAVIGNQAICVRANKDDSWITWLDRLVIAMPKMKRWMSGLNLQTKVSDLTIPGVHDAAAISWAPFTTTQEQNIPQLLKSGIRYFDIRAAYANFENQDDLVLVHGPVTIHTDYIATRMRLKDVFQQFYDFLDKEKTEGLLVQIKHDVGTWWNIDQTKNFAIRIAAMIGQSPNYWLTSSNVPTVSQLKGKIQLIRRYEIPDSAGINKDLGIDVSAAWNLKANDNNPYLDITAGSFQVRVQDYYTPAQGNSNDSLATIKWRAVQAQLNRAVADTSENLYLNFSSATNFGSLWRPWTFAVGTWLSDRGVNYRLGAFFNALQQGNKYGILIMDFPGIPSELLLALVKSNYPDLYH